MYSRWIQPEDTEVLKISLLKDEYHQGTTPEFFYAKNSVCKVYEIDKPILFVKASKALRISLQFADNLDTENNKEALIQAFQETVDGAKANGFSELIACTNSRALAIFVKRYFGFENVEQEKEDQELRKLL